VVERSVLTEIKEDVCLFVFLCVNTVSTCPKFEQ